LNQHCLARIERDICCAVKRVFHLLLLIGALIGLSGQGVAFATIVPTVSASATMSASSGAGMSDDCMKMMAQQQPAQKPCKSMTLACMAGMGCIAPMALHNDAPMLLTRQINPVLGFWPITPILDGSALAPEPEPPTLLG
jgi:hypothetical protein